MFRKAKLFENSGHGLFPILKLDASKLIWQEARSFLIALSILYSQTTEITQPLKTFSIFFCKFTFLLINILNLFQFCDVKEL